MCNGLGEYNCGGSGLKKTAETTINARIQTKPCTSASALKYFF
jgi:hypothetical protein